MRTMDVTSTVEVKKEIISSATGVMDHYELPLLLGTNLCPLQEQ